MWGRRYFPGRYFAPRYWPDGGVAAAGGTTTPQWCHNLTSRAWVHTLTSRAWVHTLTSRAWQHQLDYIGCGGVAGETQSSIVDNLVSTWTMVEVSGTRFDHFGTNHLTSNNGVDRITGAVGYGAGFTYADLATLSRASNTELQAGDVSFAFTCWAYIDEKSYFHFIISKDGSSSGQREYVLYYDKDIDRYCFLVFRATDTAVAATANNYGSVPLNTWLFIYCYHNSVTDTIGISINDGTVNTTATGGALQAASNGEFQIGGSARFPTQYTQSGGIDAVTFHKSRVLTTTEVTALYNAGAGLEYPF